MAELLIGEILKSLPHRFPMLLVDRILELEPGMSAKGLKNVTINEAFFQGHYPTYPLMPGVLIVEAMAQVGAMIILTYPEYQGNIPVIGAIDNVKFKKMVTPGDQLILCVEKVWFRSGVGKIKGEAFIEGESIAEMELTFKLFPSIV